MVLNVLIKLGNHSGMQTNRKTESLTKGVNFWLAAPQEAYCDTSICGEPVPGSSAECVMCTSGEEDCLPLFFKCPFA